MDEMDTIRRVRAVYFFLAFACLCKSGNSTPNVTVIYTICNGATFSQRESSCVKCMNNVLDIAKNNVADHGYSFYATVRDETTGFLCWAHAACNGEISNLDCFACVTRAHDLLINQCEWNIGAQFQLKDCRVRREKYEFEDD